MGKSQRDKGARREREFAPRSKKIEFVEDENGCFNCTSHYLDKDGYPKTQIRYKSCRMSRVIYEECFGEIPEGHVIRHKCDNPSCINPEHLETGTHYDNAQDKVKRKRSVKFVGESNPRSKLTEKQVIKIKEMVSEGELTQQKIASMFNVSRKTVRDIRYGKKWGYLFGKKPKRQRSEKGKRIQQTC